jgi:hypothetical protein
LCAPNKDTDAPAQPFSTDDEHAKAIDLILAMMKKGNGDIQTLKQPAVMTKGNIIILYMILMHSQNNKKYKQLT